MNKESAIPPPGPELDKLIATKVMGLTIWNDHEKFNEAIERDGDDGHCMRPPYYSTNISDAWLVWKKCPDWYVGFNGNQWEVLHGTQLVVVADTAPHAIVLASLKACEGK